MEHYLLTDLSSINWTAFYANKNMDIKDVKSCVLESILFYIKKYGIMFETNNIIFCCDSLYNIRKEIYPQYKEHRKQIREEKTEEELKLQKELYKFIPEIKIILKRIGFLNVFEISGFEADDIVASITNNDLLNKFTILSSDADLFQCLKGNVDMYSTSKQKLYTYHSFVDEFDFEPQNWWKIKALAGCTSDNITGLKGLTDKNGAKTAVKFFNKTLNKDSKIYQKINTKETIELYKKNIPLVKLPMKGCTIPVIEENRFSKKEFVNICKEYLLPYKEESLLKQWENFFLGNFYNKNINNIYKNHKKPKLTRKH